MTGLAILLAAIAIVAAFCAGCTYTEWHRPEPLDPDLPGLLDVADGARCPYETVCPSDPRGTIEPCALPAGHDGAHRHRHTWLDHDLADACYAPVPHLEWPHVAATPCCLEAGHDGPHVAALAIAGDEIRVQGRP